MNRRNFFAKCAAFVAGCAIGVKSLAEPIKSFSFNPVELSGKWEFFSLALDEPFAVSLSEHDSDWNTVSKLLAKSCLRDG